MKNLITIIAWITLIWAILASLSRYVGGNDIPTWLIFGPAGVMAAITFVMTVITVNRR